MEAASKVKSFNGIGDVKVFITKVELEASLKGYNDEKKAQYMASKLDGPAFDVYIRQSVDDKKQFTKIKDELLKEFERGQLNRDEAIQKLNDRPRIAEKSILTYAYKLTELVKLSYPSFDDANRETVAKDYFLRGLHPEMQTALKSGANFSSSDLKALTAEATRLEVAGIKSSRNTKIFPVNNCESLIDANQTDAMIDKVTEKLKTTSFNTTVSQVVEKYSSGPSRGDNVGEASFVNYYPRGGSFRQNNNRGFRRGYRGRRGDFRKSFQDVSQRKCRSCKSTEHLIQNCPTRFCQACGQRGHDQSSNTCRNFQQ